MCGADDAAVHPTLAKAQFVIARAHGFASWPTFAAHLESLARASSPVATFEAAADAMVSGDAATPDRLLRAHPALVRARSTRDHQATLVHYVSANGVENYRQKSPANAAAITRMPLDAGADVEAGANVYGGGCTTLGLVATSTPPEIAGVQIIDIVKMLVARGAAVEITDKTWGTPPLTWALTGWQEKGGEAPERSYEVVSLLVSAGAAVKTEWLDDTRVQSDPRMLDALRQNRGDASARIESAT